jgi:hypothetical protein
LRIAVLPCNFSYVYEKLSSNPLLRKILVSG